MIYATEAKLASRAKALGESASSACFAELQGYCASESPLVRRIAASAIGKLAGVVNAKVAVTTLLPLLADGHPQVRKYAAKAVSAFGADAGDALPVLRDMYRNPSEKDYVKRSVKSAGVISRMWWSCVIKPMYTIDRVAGCACSPMSMLAAKG